MSPGVLPRTYSDRGKWHRSLSKRLQAVLLLRALEGGPGDVMAKTGPLHGRPKAEQAGVNPREPGGQHQQEGNPPPPHVPKP